MTSRAHSGFLTSLLLMIGALAVILGAAYFLVAADDANASGYAATGESTLVDEPSSLESDNLKLQTELKRERQRADDLAARLQIAQTRLDEISNAIRETESIRGKVVYADGLPAEGVSVKAMAHIAWKPQAPGYDGDVDAYEKDVSAFIARLRFAPVTVATDKDGAFSLPGLLAGDVYNIEAVGPDGAQAVANDIKSGSTDVMLRLSGSGHALTGTVKAASGMLPPQMNVKVCEDAGMTRVFEQQQFLRTIDCADPRFTLPLPFAGRWVVLVEAEGFYQPTPAVVDVRGKKASIEIIMHEATALSGVVRDAAGAPLTYARVHASALTSSEDYQATTDSMGRYRMVSMCPGDYEVEAINGDFKASRTITTQIGKTNELDLAVEGGGTLTVTLRDERNAAVEIPMTTKHFNLRDSEAIRLPDAAFGTAVFQGIKPGSYELMMMLPGYGRRVDRVVINEGENALTMSLAIGGRLEGRLRFDRTPPSVPAYYVKATRADENYKHYADPDQDGMFRFESLNLGEWTVEVMNWGTREALIVRQVKIQPGDNFFDESLDIKGTLVVSVIDGATGATPRYECDVRLLDSQGRRQSVQTNKDGLAAFAGLEEGDYTLRIDPEYTSSGLPTTKQIHISAGDNEQSVRLDMADSLKITHIQPGSQAANAGIVNGDLLLTYKGEPTASYQQLRALIDATKDGEVVPLTVQRDGKTIQLKVEQWQGRMLGVNIDKAKSTAKSR